MSGRTHHRYFVTLGKYSKWSNSLASPLQRTAKEYGREILHFKWNILRKADKRPTITGNTSGSHEIEDHIDDDCRSFLCWRKKRSYNRIDQFSSCLMEPRMKQTRLERQIQLFPYRTKKILLKNMHVILSMCKLWWVQLQWWTSSIQN